MWGSFKKDTALLRNILIVKVRRPWDSLILIMKKKKKKTKIFRSKLSRWFVKLKLRTDMIVPYLTKIMCMIKNAYINFWKQCTSIKAYHVISLHFLVSIQPYIFAEQAAMVFCSCYKFMLFLHKAKNLTLNIKIATVLGLQGCGHNHPLLLNNICVVFTNIVATLTNSCVWRRRL